MPPDAPIPQDTAMANEAEVRLAVEAAGVGTWRWERGVGIVALSELAARRFGAAGGAIAHDAFLNSLHPDDRVMVDGALCGALESDLPIDLTIRAMPGEGRERRLRLCGRRVLNEDGSGSVRGIVLDDGRLAAIVASADIGTSKVIEVNLLDLSAQWRVPLLPSEHEICEFHSAALHLCRSCWPTQR